MFIELRENVPGLGEKNISVNANSIIVIKEWGSGCVIFLSGQEQGHKINMPRAELTAKLNEALRPK